MNRQFFLYALNYVLSIPLFFLCTSIIGQPAAHPQQSLKIFFDHKEPDSSRLRAANDLLQYYAYHNADSLIVVSKALKHWGQRNRNQIWEAYAYKGYATYYLVKGQSDSAKLACQRGLSIKGIKNHIVYSNLLFGLGTWHKLFGNPDSSIVYLTRGITVAKQQTSKKPLAPLYLNLAAIYLDHKKDYLKGIQALQKARIYADAELQPKIVVNLAITFISLGLLKEGHSYGLEALKLAKRSNQALNTISAYQTLVGSKYTKPEIVEKWVQEARKISVSIGINRDFVVVLIQAGNRLRNEPGYIKLAEQYLEEALEMSKKYNEVVSYQQIVAELAQLRISQGKIPQALVLCRSIQKEVEATAEQDQLFRFNVIMSTIFEQLGRVDSAFHYFKKMDVQGQKQSDIERYNQMMSGYMEYKYAQEKETARREKAAAETLANEVKKRARIRTWFFVVISLFLASTALALYWYSLQKQRTASELELRNQALNKANARLRRFSGVVSHDILSYLDLMLSAGKILVGKQPKKESLTQYYDIAQRTSRQLKDYCLGLLEEARSAVGTVSRVSEPTPVVEAILARQEIALLSKGCRVQLEPLAPSTLPESIVEQVFQNLISNALRYGMGAENPTLRIAEEKDPLRGTTRWVVEDNGAGVPQERGDGIFQGSAHQ